MKKALILATLGLTAFLSCKKEDSNNVKPQKNEVAKMTAVVGADDSLRITINYTEFNTENYLDDLLKLYFNDTFTAVFTIDPMKPNSTYQFVPRIKYTASKFRVDLIREPAPGEKMQLATISGTK